MWYLIQKILIQKRDSHRSGDNFPSMILHKLILCVFWIPPTFLKRLAVPHFRKSKQGANTKPDTIPCVPRYGRVHHRTGIDHGTAVCVHSTAVYTRVQFTNTKARTEAGYL